jgi:hypothetical protein
VTQAIEDFVCAVLQVCVARRLAANRREEGVGAEVGQCVSSIDDNARFAADFQWWATVHPYARLRGHVSLIRAFLNAWVRGDPYGGGQNLQTNLNYKFTHG